MSDQRAEAEGETLEQLLRDTLRQIGPATFLDVLQDLQTRVRFGLVAVKVKCDAARIAWQHLLQAGLIADCGESSGVFEWRPRVAVATAPRRAVQMGLFGEGD